MIFFSVVCSLCTGLSILLQHFPSKLLILNFCPSWCSQPCQDSKVPRIFVSLCVSLYCLVLLQSWVFNFPLGSKGCLKCPVKPKPGRLWDHATSRNASSVHWNFISALPMQHIKSAHVAGWPSVSMSASLLLAGESKSGGSKSHVWGHLTYLARSQKTSTKPLDAMRTGPPPLGCQLFRIVCWAPCGQDASGVIKLPQPEGDFVKWDDLVCWLHWWVFFFFGGGAIFIVMHAARAPLCRDFGTCKIE